MHSFIRMMKAEGFNLELPKFNLKFKKIPFTDALSYGTVCLLKCVFQVMLITSEVNCTIAVFRTCLTVHSCSIKLLL